jgi:PiT family inorganic phosphate transporter
LVPDLINQELAHCEGAGHGHSDSPASATVFRTGSSVDAKRYGKELGSTVEFAPWSVLILSAVALGVGTMFGYRRIVTTLGERLGKIHMTPAQSASAEVVSEIVIGVAGFTGLPVSTTHIVTSGIAGTMVTAGSGLQFSMLYRIATAWLLTLPTTILIAGGLYYLLAPSF